MDLTSHDVDKSKDTLHTELLDTKIIKTIVPTHNAVSNHAGYGGSYYYKVGSRVHVHLGIKTNTTELIKIFTLPQGFKPYSPVNATGFGGSALSSCGVSVSANGDISVQTNAGYGSIDLDFDAVS